jgi:hypothetical protein
MRNAANLSMLADPCTGSEVVDALDRKVGKAGFFNSATAWTGACGIAGAITRADVPPDCACGCTAVLGLGLAFLAIKVLQQMLGFDSGQGVLG